MILRDAIIAPEDYPAGRPPCSIAAKPQDRVALAFAGAAQGDEPLDQEQAADLDPNRVARFQFVLRAFGFRPRRTTSSAARISASIVSNSVSEKSSRQCAQTAFRAIRISPQLSVKPLNAKYGPNNRESGFKARRSQHESMRLLRAAKNCALLLTTIMGWDDRASPALMRIGEASLLPRPSL